MKLLFLLPVSTQARFHRRITHMQKAGADARALTFERDYLPGKPLPCPIETLGAIGHGRYLHRLTTYLGALRRIRQAARHAEAIHAFGLDLALLAWLATRGLAHPPQLVYEVGDIREAQTGSSLASRIVRAVEQFMIHRCQVVVVTSPRYITGYYAPVLNIEAGRFLVIENKLPIDFHVSTHRPARPVDAPLRIGYFGLLRCRRSWQTLQRVLQLAPGRFEVLLRGKLWGEAITEEGVANTAGATFDGPYISPDDLPSVYGSVDIVWAAHHHGANNLQWARANRFYEACAFARPMIGQLGTVDGEVIAEHDLGCLIDLSDIETAANRVVGLDDQHIATWTEHVAQVPEHIYRHTDEHEQLLALLDQG